MAGTAVTITFLARQDGIPVCGVVNLKFTEGDLRAEYLSGSETLTNDAEWSYMFLVQEDDLPAGLTLSEVQTCNIIAPLWSSPLTRLSKRRLNVEPESFLVSVDSQSLRPLAMMTM